MGQIITSLINFFLEVGRNNNQYKNQKAKSRSANVIVLAFIGLITYAFYLSFSSAFTSKVEVIKLRKQVESLEVLRRENDTLRIRNEILSSALSRYIGSDTVNQLNNEKDSGLKDTLREQEKKFKDQNTIGLIPQ